MDTTRAPDPIILQGILVLSSEWDRAFAQPGTVSLLEIYRLCAAAYLDGVRRMFVHDPDGICDFEKAVAGFNELLTSRGLEPMAMRTVSQGGATEKKLHAAWEERNAVESRRNLFRAGAEEPANSLADLQAIGANAPEALYFSAPVISADNCTGCDACTRVCPFDVLTNIRDVQGQSQYNVDPTFCDSCGLCEEVCSAGAIKILKMVKAPDVIPLSSWNCPHCGVPTHAPEVQSGAGKPCSVCAASGHHKKLFQVLP